MISLGTVHIDPKRRSASDSESVFWREIWFYFPVFKGLTQIDMSISRLTRRNNWPVTCLSPHCYCVCVTQKYLPVSAGKCPWQCPYTRSMHLSCNSQLRVIINNATAFFESRVFNWKLIVGFLPPFLWAILIREKNITFVQITFFQNMVWGVSTFFVRVCSLLSCASSCARCAHAGHVLVLVLSRFSVEN